MDRDHVPRHHKIVYDCSGPKLYKFLPERHSGLQKCVSDLSYWPHLYCFIHTLLTITVLFARCSFMIRYLTFRPSHFQSCDMHPFVLGSQVEEGPAE